MNAITAALEQAVGRLERARRLDRIADPLTTVMRRLLPVGPIKNTTSGTPTGHPLHPLTVAVPIGAWLGASYLDAVGTQHDRTAARRMVGLGVLTAVPAVVTGASDWTDTMGAERRVGVVHALINHAALLSYAGSWLARRSGRHGLGATLAGAGGAALAVGGWLGSHLAYGLGLGVGVDTTAFQAAITDWAEAADASAVTEGELLGVKVAGVPILLTRTDGEIAALADRCTHRGAPLHEGTLAQGCVTCPWHGSQFALSGAVRRGPAVRPQLAYQVRVVAGRVQIRQPNEKRTLRTNPV